MDSPKRFSFLATKSMSSLRAEVNLNADPIVAQKHERRAHRVFPGPDGRGTISKGEGMTRESIHSRWSSSASTVREPFEDRAYRRASEYHAKAFSPIMDTDHARKANMSLDDIQEDPGHHVVWKKSRRLGRATLDSGSDSSPPELPILRMSSFPDMMAASLSSCTPDSTPLTLSDSYTVSDTSSFQGLVGFASEFPQPPSLSPALRRMQSAPWLKDMHASFDAVDSHSWRRLSQATMERSRDMELSFPSSLADLPPFSRNTFTVADISVQKKTVDLEQAERGSPLDRLLEETNTAATASDYFYSRRHTYKTRTTDDLLEWSVSRRAQESLRPFGTVSSGGLTQRIRKPSLGNRKWSDGRRNTVSSTSPDPPLLMEKPRTIRKVASMQSQGPGKPFHEGITGQRSIPKIKSLRLFPPHSYSKHDIAGLAGKRRDTSPEPKSRNWLLSLRTSSGKAATNNNKSKSQERERKSMDAASTRVSGAGLKKKISRRERTPYPSELERLAHLEMDSKKDAEKGVKIRTTIRSKSRRHRRESHLSGLGFAHYDSFNGGSRSSVNIGLGLAGSASTSRLDGPFTLRKGPQAQAHDPGASGEYMGGGNTSVETSTSFMDITPERGAKADKPAAVEQRKDRVRKFIAKASSGFMEWRRGLGAKKGHLESP
ncbi:hypothetical protein D9611_003798 [Ephemerocybe angulata]|uniref:Uncharacterized protein n=1 Tax=Ephemerocybe angulata TaxID=980116 RepID=A0A8H5B5Q0_9AGAR|nr:hypothetical protein D9611_003798 [Tulosesus angulatus]